MDNKKFLTIAEVAAEFGIDEAALQGFVDSGEVRALADRGTWKYRRDELQMLLDTGKVAPPTGEIWLDDASSNDEILKFGSDADDELSYIELDEEALAEHATMITKKSPFEDRTPVDEISNPEDWFAPSDAREMRSEVTDPSQSASDVRIYTGDLSDDPAVARSLQSSDSDVRLADDAVLSDSIFDLGETSEKSDSDSDVRLAGAGRDLVSSTSPRAAELSSDSDSDVRVAPRMLDSDSDVRIASSQPASGSGVRLATDSDSDVKIADNETIAASDNSGIVLDFDFGAGATVSASGSSLRLPQTAMNEQFLDQDEDELGSGVWSGSAGSLSGLDDDSDVILSDVASSSDGGSALRLGADDSGISLFGLDESGIALDGGSHLRIPATGSAVLLGGSGTGLGSLSDDSGVSLAPAGDSGLTLEPPLADSGLALESAESAASVMDDESGISLGLDDSGLALEADDSGLSLESSGDSGISLTSLDKTLSEGDFTSSMFDNDAGRTQTLDISSQFDDDSSFDMNLSDTGQTAELQIGDEEDDFAETAATVVKKGRGKTGPGLTEAFKLDDSMEVEDLDIADELEAGVDVEDDEEVAEVEEDEVFDASEETFSDEVDAVEDDDGEGYITAAAGAAAAAKAFGPREPSWGMGMSVGLIAGSLFLAANGLIMWAGVSSMWNGADPTGPAAGLISQLAGMIGG